MRRCSFCKNAELVCRHSKQQYRIIDRGWLLGLLRFRSLLCVDGFIAKHKPTFEAYSVSEKYGTKASTVCDVKIRLKLEYVKDSYKEAKETK